MQRRQFLSSSLAAAAALDAQTPGQGSAAREYYELRCYHLQSGPTTKVAHKYIEEALIPALNRLGMKTVGSFDLYLGPETPSIYVLIPSNSLEALVTSEQRLAQDDEYRKAGEAFLGASAKEPAYLRIESSLLAAFDGYPKLTVPPVTAQHGARVFQLRTYESPGIAAHRRKIEMFHSGEFGIFEKAGFWSIFYGDALIGPRLPKLTYMVGFPDLSELDAKWKAFFADPDWKKLSASSKFSYEAIVSSITNLILKPAPYSQI
jgi:NIPSNAP